MANENEQPKNDWKEREMGGLYKKKTQSGQTILKGKIGDQRVIIMSNKYKTAENHPDYRVYKDTYDPSAQQGGPAAKPVATSTTKPKSKPAPVVAPTEDDDAAF